jgi:aminopeptidase N
MPRSAPPLAWAACVAAAAATCLAAAAFAAGARPLPYPVQAGYPVDADKPALERLAGPFAARAESLHNYDALHYRLDLAFPCVGTNLSGSCAITLRAGVPVLATVALDCVSLNVDGVTQDGAAAPFTHADGQLNVSLPRPLAAGEVTTLAVTYHGPAVHGYIQAYPETWFTFTEPSYARCWFPCYDQPWDKATSEIHATVPDTMFVSSNGVQTAPPDLDPLAHRRTYHWATDYPIATYLMSVAIGHYVELSDSAMYVPLRSYVLRADSARAVHDFANVPDMINYYGSLWGQYPFENYGMSATKDFGGGMEHQTRTTIARAWITGNRSYEWAIAHELSHMWWGDMVTCLTWPNVWINEGFASYGDILYAEHAYGAGNARARMQAWAQAYFKEESTLSYPLYDPPAGKLFGLSIYFKGAWALHMLRHVMGDSAFIGGWRDFGAANRYGGGTVAGFQSSMEARHGAPLGWFFEPWVYGTGYPVLRVGRSCVPRAAGGYYNYLKLEQVQPGPSKFRMPVEVLLHSGGRDTLATVWIESTITSTQFTLAAPLDSVTVDPDGWLLHRLSGSGCACDTWPAAAPDGPRISRVRLGRGVVELECELPSDPAGKPGTLELFDVTGRRVATLWRPDGVAGAFRVRWAGALGEGAGSPASAGARHGPAPTGMYFARLTAAGRSASAKVLWLR